MEILNVGTTVVDYLGGWSISVSVLIVCGIVFFALALISTACDCNSLAPLGWIIGIICIFGAFQKYSTNNPVKKTTYQVILDDSISYNEFVEKYEVIKQEGRIYTIYEK